MKKKRPKLVIGFAAETDDLKTNAAEKLKRKNCDWIVANKVGLGKGFAVDENEVTVFRVKGRVEKWQRQSKKKIAEKLVDEIAKRLV